MEPPSLSFADTLRTLCCANPDHHTTMGDSTPPPPTNGATSSHPMLTKTLPPLVNRRARWVVGEVSPGAEATVADVELVSPAAWLDLASWWGDGAPLLYVFVFCVCVCGVEREGGVVCVLQVQPWCVSVVLHGVLIVAQIRICSQGMHVDTLSPPFPHHTPPGPYMSKWLRTTQVPPHPHTQPQQQAYAPLQPWTMSWSSWGTTTTNPSHQPAHERAGCHCDCLRVEGCVRIVWQGRRLHMRLCDWIMEQGCS